jgi:uncharacterized protein
MPNLGASMLSGNALSNSVDLNGQVIGDLPDWGARAALDLLSTLTSRESRFPCTFAVTAALQSSLRFGFVEDPHDRDSWRVLPVILSEYLRTYRTLPRETSLIVLFGAEDRIREIGEYQDRFWEILQFLHEVDGEPWPAGIPKDVDDPYWEFSFAGTSLFVVCNTPAHQSRRSRANDNFMITFQPRSVFEGIAAGTPRGDAARRTIRARLRAFDEVEPSPRLGNYGDPDNREWRQYFLPEGDTDAVAQCPFQHR